MTSKKKPPRDVFNAEMVQGARYRGQYEFPALQKSDFVPEKLVSFNKRKDTGDKNWLHFFVHDYTFSDLWHDYKSYLKVFRGFAGVILPDYSLYRDMPLAMQIWSTYKSRAVGHWLQYNNVSIIPNIRWGDERSYDFVFDGIAQGGTVAVGSHGCIKSLENRGYFIRGFNEMLNRIKPETVVVYGRLRKEVEELAKNGNVKLLQFDSEIQVAHNKREA